MIASRRFTADALAQMTPKALAFLLAFAVRPERKQLLIRTDHWRLIRVEDKAFISDLVVGKVAYPLGLTRQHCHKRGTDRWLVSIADLNKVPGLAEAIAPSGIFRSIRSPNTHTLILSRLVAALRGDFIEWGNEDEDPDLWRVVHHRDRDTLNDADDNVETMPHGGHEDEHHQAGDLIPFTLPPGHGHASAADQEEVPPVAQQGDRDEDVLIHAPVMAMPSNLTRPPLKPTSAAVSDFHPDQKDAGDSKPRRRGRPSLGVTPGEVTLLPDDWAWLKQQPGGASAALRRLVMAARMGQERS